MKKEDLNYENALNELKAIIQDIEKGEITVDELSIKVKRAGQLILFCQSKLKDTEEDIDKILKEMNFNE